jgi:tetraacyldisaccharide 4'-kinase
LFDKKILKSAEFNFPIICVGNLATGGTGKTPMTEYLIRLLRKNYKTATLSRGYKRKTKGYAIANASTTAVDIGDEPMQFHLKFDDIYVAVGEERVVAVPQILQDRPDTEVIILDDAFQHRSINAGLNILLTDHSNLYTDDRLLPAGNLRDIGQSAERADIIIITKCPAALSEMERQKIIKEINPNPNQQVYFTTINYSRVYHLFTGELLKEPINNVLLVCGIANPAKLIEYVKSKADNVEVLDFPDHHIFTSVDLGQLKKTYQSISKENQTIILTTEKDAVRLQKFKMQLQDIPTYSLPMEHQFLFDGAEEFNQQVINFIKSFKKDKLPS